MQTHGIPVYEQKNAINNDRTFRFFINKQKFEELSRFQVRTNDLIISCSGTVGKISIIKDEDPKGIISQALLILRPDVSKIRLKYLYYFLSSKQGFELLTQASHGSVQINIAERKVVESIPILLPPLPEQKAIAGVLSSLDDKIDLLHRHNRTLEAMAEALFRQWFVEEADEGWEERKLEELCTITRGSSPRPIIKYIYNGTVPWIKIADGSRSSNFFIDSTNEFIIEEGVSKSVKVFPGDLILSNSATCGFPYFVEIEGCIHDGWLLFRDFKGITKLFLFFFIKTIFNELNNIADGSVQNNLNTGILKEYLIKLPNIDLVTTFDKHAEIFINKLKQNQLQIRTLEKLRDTLLPKLMCGEVRVVT
ncbi:MAG: restriction endonuclease subunit S [Spirochaetales bacterium]|nr:restriction endonuclease subunit S [Spirochaetales bacterium]